MNRKDVFIVVVLFFVGIISRIPFLEKIQSYWDGPQYSIAILRYSFTQETPAAPGYPLYIALGRFFYTFTHDPHTALLWVSVLFCGLGAVMYYLLGKTICNRVVGVIASLLYLSGSTFYFFGITPYAYGGLPVLYATLALVIYQIMFKRKKYWVLLGVVYAFIVGFRPQELLLSFPFIFLGCGFLPAKERKKSFLIFTVGCLMWFLPYFFIAGGANAFLSAFIPHGKNPIPPLSFTQFIDVRMTLVKGFFLSVGVSGVFLLYYLFRLIKQIKQKRLLQSVGNTYVLFFASWVAASLFFNLFIRSDNPGYQMGYLSACITLISIAIYKTLRNKIIITVAVSLLVVFNLYWFFHDRDPDYKLPFTSTSFHYSEIRKNDLKLGSKLQLIQKEFPSQYSLIITSPDAWRPLMYYLKMYHVWDIDALVTNDMRYKSIVRKSFDWNYKQVVVLNNTLVIPKKIKYIVFTDDKATAWVKDSNKKTVTPLETVQ